MSLLSTIIVQHSAPQYPSLLYSLKIHYDRLNTAAVISTRKY